MLTSLRLHPPGPCSVVGPVAFKTMPRFRQLFIRRDDLSGARMGWPVCRVVIALDLHVALDLETLLQALSWSAGCCCLCV